MFLEHLKMTVQWDGQSNRRRIQHVGQQFASRQISRVRDMCTQQEHNQHDQTSNHWVEQYEVKPLI